MFIFEIILVVVLMVVLLKVTPTENGFRSDVKIKDVRYAYLSASSMIFGTFLIFSGIYILGAALAVGGTCYTWVILQYDHNKSYKEAYV